MSDKQSEETPLLRAQRSRSSGELVGHDGVPGRSSVEHKQGSSSSWLQKSRGSQHGSDDRDVSYKPRADESSAEAHDSRCTRIRCVRIEPIIMVFMLCLTSFIQLFPQYVYARLYQKYNVSEPAEDSTCEFQDATHQESIYDAIEQEMATYNTASYVFYIVPGIFLLPVIGPFSEQIGRKPFIVVPVLGALTLYTIMTAIIYYDLPLDWVYMALTFLGISGAAIVPAMGMIYITDTTVHSQRISRFIILEISSMTGGCAADIGTGYIIEYLGFFSSTFICVLLLAGLFLYALFLPESLQAQKKGVLSDWSEIGKGFMVYVKDDGTRRRYKLQICLLILALLTLADMGSTTILTYFFLDPPFCWASDEIGIFNAVDKALKIITSALITRLLVGRMPDSLLMFASAASLAGFFLVLTFSNTTWMAYTAAFMSCAMMVQMAFVLIGVYLFSYIYAASARTYHGMALLVAAGIMFVVIGLVIMMACSMRLEPKVVVPSDVICALPARNSGTDQVHYKSLPKTELNRETSTIVNARGINVQ